MGGFSRVLANPQMLESQQAPRVEGHQHFSAFHDVQAEGPGTEDDPLGFHTEGQHHAILVLGQDGHAVVEGDERDGAVEELIILSRSNVCDRPRSRFKLHIQGNNSSLPFYTQSRTSGNVRCMKPD